MATYARTWCRTGEGRAGRREHGRWLAVVTLDSLVPGKDYGRIGRAQLDWLGEVLAAPAAHGTLLAFHHPPVALEVEVQRALGLQDADELGAVIRGTDVQLILCGHFHLQILGRLEQATVWVTPGIVSRIDLTAQPDTERAVHGPSASLVRLGTPHGPLIHTLHARDPRAVATEGEAVDDGRAEPEEPCRGGHRPPLGGGDQDARWRAVRRSAGAAHSAPAFPGRC
ncbi:metallophosphoesterase family protein [Streptomyces canus]|uniref:metallophosphoesterase family protein n=1 Tax=Streptomyces canus TaxID=58343 RepID=UPI003864226D